MTRRLALVCAAALLAVGCFDFGLEGRRFRCDDDPAICGEGGYCDPRGFCVPNDGRELCGNAEDDDGDGQIDCADPDCGPESCDDDNMCTADSCVSSGDCRNEPAPVSSTCGAGCICEADGAPKEVACGDLIDNDGDDLADCMDPDCPMCAGGLECCPGGGCRTSCE